MSQSPKQLWVAQQQQAGITVLDETLQKADNPIADLKGQPDRIAIVVPYEWCYDEQTEVLTEAGFKRFADIEENDQFATLSDDGFLEYQKATNIIRRHYTGQMIAFNAIRTDFLVTPEHKMFVKPYWAKKNFEFIEAQNLVRRKRLLFKRDARWKGNADQSHAIIGKFAFNMDDWLRFLGWYISEGCIVHYAPRRSYQIYIAQTKEKYRPEIADAIRRLGFKPFIGKTSISFYSKELFQYLKQFGKSGDKFIPKEYLEMPPERLKVLFETMMKGDGSDDKNNYVYVTKSKRLADDVQEIALKIGLSSMMKPASSPIGSWFIVQLSRHHGETEYRGKTKFVDYDGDIFDVTVPNHTLFVRRNGKTTWGSNCWPEALKPGTNPTHKRLYDADLLAEHLEAAGYRSHVLKCIDYQGWTWLGAIGVRTLNSAEKRRLKREHLQHRNRESVERELQPPNVVPSDAGQAGDSGLPDGAEPSQPPQRL